MLGITYHLISPPDCWQNWLASLGYRRPWLVLANVCHVGVKATTSCWIDNNSCGDQPLVVNHSYHITIQSLQARDREARSGRRCVVNFHRPARKLAPDDCQAVPWGLLKACKVELFSSRVWATRRHTSVAFSLQLHAQARGRVFSFESKCVVQCAQQP